MKKLFLALILFLAASCFSQAFAASGDYVCNAGGDNAKSVENVLNSMKCDKTKPFTVSIAWNGYIIVCCVEQ